MGIKVKKIGIILFYIIISILMWRNFTRKVYDTMYSIRESGSDSSVCTEDQIVHGGYGIRDTSDSSKYQMAATGIYKYGDFNYPSILFQRASNSDYVTKRDGVYKETAYIFTTRLGEHSLSRGTWQYVTDLDYEGDNNITSIVGLVNIGDTLESGYGQQLYEYVCNNSSATIRMSKYAKDNAVYYPLELILYDNDGNESECIECTNNVDTSDMEVEEGENTWLLCDSLLLNDVDSFKEKYESVMNSTGEALEYANRIEYNLDYSQDICKKGIFYVSPRRIANYIMYVKDGYAYIYVEIIKNPMIPICVAVGMLFIFGLGLLLYKGTQQKKSDIF